MAEITLTTTDDLSKLAGWYIKKVGTGFNGHMPMLVLTLTNNLTDTAVELRVWSGVTMKVNGLSVEVEPTLTFKIADVPEQA